MNSVNLIGRWTRDHEVSTVGQQGTTLVKNTIAVDHPFKKDSASFLRVVMWGKTGELANQYTGKGSLVGIEGYLETGSFDDKDGKKVFTVDVIVSRVKFLEPKGTNNQQNQNNGYQQQGDMQNNAPNNAYNGNYGQSNTNTQNYNQNANTGNYATNNGMQNDPFTGGGQVNVTDDDLPF